jgi:hypothetical protein
MDHINNATCGLAALEDLRQLIRTAQDSELQIRCLDHAISEFKQIKAEAVDATLSLVMNRTLRADQYYLLRHLGIITCSNDPEYANYLRMLEEGGFQMTHRDQWAAAAAWVGMKPGEDLSGDEIQPPSI